jgi:cytochrome c oxidase assembly protein subunit 15
MIELIMGKKRNNAFLGLLIFTFGVILWGAYVRMSGSGDGCGPNWPHCKGSLAQKKTAIEFFHRASSGLCLLLTLICSFWVLKTEKSPHPLVRKTAYVAIGSILLESALGAGLVLLGLVGKNSSWARAFVMSFHLANTCLLLAALLLLFLRLSPIEKFPELNPSDSPLDQRVSHLWQWDSRYTKLCMSFCLVVSSGGVAALADTLFPASSFIVGLLQDFQKDSVLLLRVRIVHPFFALCFSFFAFYVVSTFPTKTVLAKRFSLAFQMGLFLQLLVGVMNLVLLNPLWMQLIHLGLALILWLCLVGLIDQDMSEKSILRT